MSNMVRLGSCKLAGGGRLGAADVDASDVIFRDPPSQRAHVHDMLLYMYMCTCHVMLLLILLPNPHPGSCYTGLRVLRRHDS